MVQGEHGCASPPRAQRPRAPEGVPVDAAVEGQRRSSVAFVIRRLSHNRLNARTSGLDAFVMASAGPGQTIYPARHSPPDSRAASCGVPVYLLDMSSPTCCWLEPWAPARVDACRSLLLWPLAVTGRVHTL